MANNYSDEIIRNTAMEDSDTLRYYTECIKFLDSFLSKYPNISSCSVCDYLHKLLLWLCAEPTERNRLVVTDVDVGIFLFGMVGKAIFFLQNQNSPQFREELRRLFADWQQVRGNAWLFYTAGQLAMDGFEIEFIRERAKEGKQTPDFWAKRGETKAFFESHARSTNCKSINDLATLLWDVLQGDKSSGKQLKFQDPQYYPGIIALDISQCNYEDNAAGLLPYLKLDCKAFLKYEDGRYPRYVYDITEDKDFFNRPQNQGNVISYAIDYFRQIDKVKYQVRGLLVGISMRYDDSGKGVKVVAPKGAFMIIDKTCPELAISEIAPAIYLVD
jgi:hypothetical protein